MFSLSIYIKPMSKESKPTTPEIKPETIKEVIESNRAYRRQYFNLIIQDKETSPENKIQIKKNMKEIKEIKEHLELVKKKLDSESNGLYSKIIDLITKKDKRISGLEWERITKKNEKILEEAGKELEKIENIDLKKYLKQIIKRKERQLQTEPKPEPKSEPEQKEKQQTIAEILKGLDEKRTAYVKQDRDFKKADAKDDTGFAKAQADLGEVKLDYERVKNQYAHQLYLEKKENLKKVGINEDDPRFKEEIYLFIAELSEAVVLREQDKLAKEKVDELEPRKRTWFRKMIADYARMPMWKKGLISTGIVTGVALSGGVMGVTAAAAFGGYRFLRGMAIGSLAMSASGIVKIIGTGKVEEYRRREINDLNSRFGTDIESISEESEFQRMFRDRCQEYEKIVREVNRRHRNITRWSIGAAVAVGGLTAAGLTITNLDGPLSNMINQRFGLAETTTEAPEVICVETEPSIGLTDALETPEVQEIAEEVMAEEVIERGLKSNFSLN